MIEKPPKWEELLSGELIRKVHDSKETQEILSKAQKEYVYWDKFKYYLFPFLTKIFLTQQQEL